MSCGLLLLGPGVLRNPVQWTCGMPVSKNHILRTQVEHMGSATTKEFGGGVQCAKTTTELAIRRLRVCFLAVVAGLRVPEVTEFEACLPWQANGRPRDGSCNS